MPTAAVAEMTQLAIRNLELLVFRTTTGELVGVDQHEFAYFPLWANLPNGGKCACCGQKKTCRYALPSITIRGYPSCLVSENV